MSANRQLECSPALPLHDTGYRYDTAVDHPCVRAKQSSCSAHAQQHLSIMQVQRYSRRPSTSASRETVEVLIYSSIIPPYDTGTSMIQQSGIAALTNSMIRIPGIQQLLHDTAVGHATPKIGAKQQLLHSFTTYSSTAKQNILIPVQKFKNQKKPLCFGVPTHLGCCLRAARSILHQSHDQQQDAPGLRLRRDHARHVLQLLNLRCQRPLPQAQHRRPRKT